MKLEEGKSYPAGFVYFIGLDGIFWFISSFFNVPEPAFLGFSISIVCLVILQAYSGVALDKAWVASISKTKQPVMYWIILCGQLAVAALCVLSAFKG